MYYKNKDNQPYFEPSKEVIKRDGLVKITKEEFEDIIAELNTPTEKQVLEQRIVEAKAYLTDTGWIWEKYNRNVLLLKDMTNEEFNLKYSDVISKQEEYRALINELEVQLLVRFNKEEV